MTKEHILMYSFGVLAFASCFCMDISERCIHSPYLRASVEAIAVACWGIAIAVMIIFH